MNAVATEPLDVVAEADQGDRRARLRAKAAAQGTLASVQAPLVAPGRRARIVEAVRGLGPMADALIAEERDRL